VSVALSARGAVYTHAASPWVLNVDTVLIENSSYTVCGSRCRLSGPASPK